MPREINVGGIAFGISAETGEFKGNVEDAIKILKRFESEANKTGRSTAQVAKQYGVSNKELKTLQNVLKQTAQSQKDFGDSLEGTDEFEQRVAKQALLAKQAQRDLEALREEVESLGRSFTPTGKEAIATERAIERLTERTKRIEVVTRLIDLAEVKKNTTIAADLAINNNKRVLEEVRKHADIERAIIRTNQAIIRQDNEANNELILQDNQALNTNLNELERQRTLELRAAKDIQTRNARAAADILVNDTRTQNKLIQQEEASILKDRSETHKQELNLQLDRERTANKERIISLQHSNNLELSREREAQQIRKENRAEERRLEREAAKAKVQAEKEKERAVTRGNREQRRQIRRTIAAQNRLNRGITNFLRRYLSFRNLLGLATGTGLFGAIIKNTTQFSATLVETAEGLGITASELDAFRRTVQSFGLEALQADRALTNIAEGSIEARNGIVEMQRAFTALDIPANLRNPLEILEHISRTIGDLDPSVALEAIGALTGERARTIVAGLLAEPGRFEAELARQRELGLLDDAQLQRNKDLDQTFVDLQNVIRRQLIETIADNADKIEDFTLALTKAIPRIADFVEGLVGFAFGPGGIGFGAGFLAQGAAGQALAFNNRLKEMDENARRATRRVGALRIGLLALGSIIGLATFRTRELDQRLLRLNSSSDSVNDTIRKIRELEAQLVGASELDRFSIENQINQILGPLNNVDLINLDSLRSEIRDEVIPELEKQLELIQNSIRANIDLGRDSPFIQESVVAANQLIAQIGSHYTTLSNIEDLYVRVFDNIGAARDKLNNVLLDGIQAETRTLSRALPEWQKQGEEIQSQINLRDQLKASIEEIEAISSLGRDDSIRRELIFTQDQVTLLKQENTLREQRLRFNDREFFAQRTRGLLLTKELELLDAIFNNESLITTLQNSDLRNLEYRLQIEQENSNSLQVQIDLAKTLNILNNEDLQILREKAREQEALLSLNQTTLSIEEKRSNLANADIRRRRSIQVAADAQEEIVNQLTNIQLLTDTITNRSQESLRETSSLLTQFHTNASTLSQILLVPGLNIQNIANVSEEARTAMRDIISLGSQIIRQGGLTEEELENINTLINFATLGMENWTGRTKENAAELRNLSRLWEDLLKKVAENIVDIGVNLAKSIRQGKNALEAFAKSLADLTSEVLKVILLRSITSRIDQALVARGFNEIFRSTTNPTGKQLGGYALGGTIVGESGPEYVDFRNPGRVYSNAVLRSALAGGGDRNSLSLQFNIDSNNPHVIRAEILNTIPIIEQVIEGKVVTDMQKDSPIRRSTQNLIRQ